MAKLALTMPGRVGSKFLQPCNERTKQVSFNVVIKKDCEVYTPGYGCVGMTLKRKDWKTEWDIALGDNTCLKEARAIVDRVNAHSGPTANKFYKLHKAAGDAKRSKEIAAKILGEEIPWPEQEVEALTTEQKAKRIQELVALYSRSGSRYKNGPEDRNADDKNGSEEESEEEDADQFSKDEAVEDSDTEGAVAPCAHAGRGNQVSGAGGGDGEFADAAEDRNDADHVKVDRGRDGPVGEIRQGLAADGAVNDEVLLCDLPKLKPAAARIPDFFPVAKPVDRGARSAKPVKTYAKRSAIMRVRKRTRVMIPQGAQNWVISMAQLEHGPRTVPAGFWFDEILKKGIQLGRLSPRHNPEGLRSMVRRHYGWCEQMLG